MRDRAWLRLLAFLGLRYASPKSCADHSSTQYEDGPETITRSNAAPVIVRRELRTNLLCIWQGSSAIGKSSPPPVIIVIGHAATIIPASQLIGQHCPIDMPGPITCHRQSGPSQQDIHRTITGVDQFCGWADAKNSARRSIRADRRRSFSYSATAQELRNRPLPNYAGGTSVAHHPVGQYREHDVGRHCSSEAAILRRRECARG